MATGPANRCRSLPRGTDSTVIAAADDFRRRNLPRLQWLPGPSRLLHGVAGGTLTEIKRKAPSFFDAADLEVANTSPPPTAGPLVPYFVVRHRHDRSPRPALLGGYGGFGLPDAGHDRVLGRL